MKSECVENRIFHEFYEKDLARLEKFMESGQFDEAALSDILKRHGLDERWNEIKNRIVRS